MEQRTIPQGSQPTDTHSAQVTVGGRALVERIQTSQRIVAHFQARMLADMAALAEVMEQLDCDHDPEFAFDAAAAELSAALHWTRRAAETELGHAINLSTRLPRLLQALAEGRLDWRRVWVILQGTGHLDQATAQAVVNELLERASGMTTGQVRALLTKMCIQADPDGAANRYEEAVADRRIIAEANPAGTTNLLGLDLPPHQVAEAIRHINSIAESLKTSGEIRTMDQLRADVLLDLLTGSGAGGVSGRGTVDLHVDLTTLLELSENPGELAGYGPVIADIARQVAERQLKSEWRWTLTHTESGQVLCNGTTRRRPTAHQRRQVEARQPTCIFPGCRMPALRCDLDHRQPWSEGGSTCHHNLEPLCRHHHQIRHRHHWTHQPLPDGDHLWQSPLGHRYTTSGRSP